MAIRLVSPLSECEPVTRVTPTAGVTLGDLVDMGDTSGFALITADPSQENQETFTLIISAPKVEVDLATGSGADISQGEAFYYNASTGKGTTASTGNELCLIALEAGTASDTKLLAKFDGRMTYLKA